MIEVEAKFKLSESDIERLTAGAEFLNERTFTDLYYDSDDYDLTTADRWLRQRDGRWELKIRMEGKRELINQYRELIDEKEIAEALGLKNDVDLIETVLAAGNNKFCVCKTTRRKYRQREFIIDLDLVEFSDFEYRIGEIELLVENETQMEEAKRKIAEFAAKMGLVVLPVRGKVIEYLLRKKPEHYQALVLAGIVT